MNPMPEPRKGLPPGPGQPQMGASSALDGIIAEMAEHLDWIAGQATFHLNTDANEGAPLTDNEDTNRELLRLSVDAFADQLDELVRGQSGGGDGI